MSLALNANQIAALKYVDKNPGTAHKASDNPGAPHHKTMEALNVKGLVTSKNGGYVVTPAGKSALVDAK